jgi:hypothetical protein
VGQFLAGAGGSSLTSSYAAGVDGCSTFDDSDGYGLAGPG